MTDSPRYYLDRRPAAIALRDREADGPNPTFGPDEPGVISYLVATVRDDGTLALDDTRLVTWAFDLNQGSEVRLRHANDAMREKREKREKREREAREQRDREALWKWQAAFAEAIVKLIRDIADADELYRRDYGSDQHVNAEIGPLGKGGFRGGTMEMRLVEIAVYTYDGRITWDLKRQDAAALRDFAAFLGTFQRLVEDLEALSAEWVAKRPGGAL